jgi:hypothetical protein
LTFDRLVIERKGDVSTAIRRILRLLGAVRMKIVSHWQRTRDSRMIGAVFEAKRRFRLMNKLRPWKTIFLLSAFCAATATISPATTT